MGGWSKGARERGRRVEKEGSRREREKEREKGGGREDPWF